MVTSAVDQSACKPFLAELMRLADSHVAGARLRERVHALGIGRPHINDFEYWACELRQLRTARFYGRAADWYVDILDSCLTFAKALEHNFDWHVLSV